MRDRLLVLTLAFLLPARLSSQVVIGGLDKLFERFSGINLYAGSSFQPSQETSTRGEILPWGHDQGLEFTFGLLRPKAQNTPLQYDTAKVEVKTSGGTTETVTTLTPKPRPPIDTRWDLELGIGYGQFNDLHGTNPAYDLHGSMRELPSVAVYGSYTFLRTKNWNTSMFVGARTGVLALQNMQLYLPPVGVADTSRVFTANATTFEFGGSIGIDIGIRDVDFFVEYSSTQRRFNSVDFSADAKFLPNVFPRTLNFSGKAIDFGIALSLPGK
jgi:hypothetical protein